MLREGWDVALGGDDPCVFASVEWVPWGPEVPEDERVAEVALRVQTKEAAASTTTIDVALFDPLE